MKKDNLFECRCDTCTFQCCGDYAGAENTLTPLSGRSFKDIILTGRDVAAIRAHNAEHLMYIDDNGLGHIKTAPDGHCFAFQNGKCSINGFKPTICKAYPLYLDLFIGLCAHKECPAVTSAQNIVSFTDELVPFLDMCEFWLNYYNGLEIVKTLRGGKSGKETEI